MKMVAWLWRVMVQLVMQVGNIPYVHRAGLCRTWEPCYTCVDHVFLFMDADMVWFVNILVS